MTILVFGKSGQVGWELQRSLSLFPNVVFLDRTACDLSNRTQIAMHIDAIKPNFIIKAAAYTAVDKAESEPEIAHAINATAAGVMAEGAKRHNAHLIHYSTDYVYAGAKQGIYEESDKHEPLNIYGKSKSDGESLIAQATDRFTILRTSWVYSQYGACFPRAILNRAKIVDSLDVVDDQVGSPTSAHLIADVTALMAREILRAPDDKRFHGSFNLVSNGYTSWFDYAKLLLELSEKHGIELKAKDVLPTKSVQTPGKAVRPMNSRLAVAKLEKALGISLPSWQQDVERFIEEFKKIRT